MANEKKKPYKNVDNGRKPGKGGIFPPDNTGKKYVKRQPEGVENRGGHKPEIWVNVDIENLKELCSIGCTMREVEKLTGYSHETISKALELTCGMSWKQFFTEHSHDFKASLRRMQYRSAMGDFDEEGNKYRVFPSVPMQIWLGKQFLGQTDKQELETTDKTNIPVFEWATEDADHEDLTDQKEIEESKKRLNDANIQEEESNED